jgi:hypothetical protein
MGNYKHSKEMEQFSGLNNVCFLPHKQYLWGMRERHVVHYPFARMIAQGKLAEVEEFSNFTKGSVLVLCNLRPEINGKKNARPDIIALTNDGDIFIVECKIKGKSESDGLKASIKLSAAAGQLAFYAKQLKEYATKSLKVTSGSMDRLFEIWSDLHNNVYSNIHGFPAVDDLLSACFSMSIDEQKNWVLKIFSALSKGEIQYALAFNGPNDGDTPGYDSISRKMINKNVFSSWDIPLKKLMLFSIDHNNECFEIIDSNASNNLLPEREPLIQQLGSKKKINQRKTSKKEFWRDSIEGNQKLFYEKLEKINGIEFKVVAEKLYAWGKGKFNINFPELRTTEDRYRKMIFNFKKHDVLWIKTNPCDVKINISTLKYVSPFKRQDKYDELISKLQLIHAKEGESRFKISLLALSDPRTFDRFCEVIDWIIGEIKCNE